MSGQNGPILTAYLASKIRSTFNPLQIVVSVKSYPVIPMSFHTKRKRTKHERVARTMKTVRYVTATWYRSAGPAPEFKHNITLPSGFLREN